MIGNFVLTWTYCFFCSITVGWGRDAAQQQQQFQYGVYGGPDQRQPGFKSNALNLIHSIRTVMRIPLIFFNVVTIVFKLIAGWGARWWRGGGGWEKAKRPNKMCLPRQWWAGCRCQVLLIVVMCTRYLCFLFTSSRLNVQILALFFNPSRSIWCGTVSQ